MKNLVYLAGPITGLSWEDANDWRNQVKNRLPRHISTLSPLRGKQYLEQRSTVDGKINDCYEDYPLSSSRGINTRDYWDCTRATVVFVNLLGAKTVSIGTVMEIAWAYANKIPTILVMEESGNIHEHAMIRESVGFRVPTLDMGVEILVSLLCTDQEIEELEAWHRDQMMNDLLAEKLLLHETDGPLKQIAIDFNPEPKPTPVVDLSQRNRDGSPYKSGYSGQAEVNKNT